MINEHKESGIELHLPQDWRTWNKKRQSICFFIRFDSHSLKPKKFHPRLLRQFNRSQTTQLKHWTSEVKQNPKNFCQLRPEPHLTKAAKLIRKLAWKRVFNIFAFASISYWTCQTFSYKFKTLKTNKLLRF